MRRRQFIIAAGMGAVSTFSGCLGSNAPPPRKSNVVTDCTIQNGKLVVSLADDTWVMSRYDGNQQSLGVNPIGVAEAKGKGGGGGRGATGRGTGGYSKAPRTRHGFAWYHGGDYTDDWYENHDDEVKKYGVTVAAVGIAYLGRTEEMQEEAPDAGPVPWDKQVREVDDTVKYDVSNRNNFRQEGWYRVGAHVVGENVNHDFRWESYDLEIDKGSSGFEIEEEWKVSPRI